MESSEVILQLSSISKRFSSAERKVDVLSGIDLTVRACEIVCLVGRSGVGKTTLLNIIAGIEPATSGSISGIEQKTGIPLPFVFQENALFPWMRAIKNVALPLLVLGESRKRAFERAGELLGQLGLGDIPDVYPLRLSGGMAKRAEVARALITGAPLVLFDEPFAGLDYFRRIEMRTWLDERLRQFNAAALIVTHDVEDAVALGDRVLVLAGRPASIVRAVKTGNSVPSDPPDQNLVSEILDALGHS